MKYTLIIFFSFISLFSFGQTWNSLAYNPDQPKLELNPLKGLTPLYDVSNEFPHSIRGKIIGLDKVMFGFEPEDFDWSEFDNFLDEEGAKGNFAKLQVNVDMGFNRSDLPQFLKDAGVGHAYYDGQGTGDNQGVPSVVVDYNNSEMMRALEIFVEEFGKKYNNDPRVFMVHYGLYGIFGEWGLGSGEVLVPAGETWTMSEENQNRIAAAYESAFDNKNLLARFPENTPQPELVGYSDGLYFGASISDEEQYGWFFHRRLLSENADQNWKNHPIGGEVDPHIQGTLWTNFPNTITGDPDLIGANPPLQNTDEIFNLTRPTFLFQDWIFNENNLTQESNPTMWENALKATKKTGYTFQINEYRISVENNNPAIEVNILNKGLAPMYSDWEVEFAYLDGNGNIKSLGTTDDWNLSTIQPDVQENYRSFISSESIPSGTHTFLMKVKNPLDAISNGAEPVRFANFTQDQDVDGWLTLGDATIINGSLGQHPRRVSNMFLIPSSTTMGLQDQFQLTAQVFSGIATNRSVTWSSNKPSTASVDENGLVTTYNISGEVEITAYTQGGNIEKVATITVNPFWNVPGQIEAEGFATLNNGRIEGTPDGEPDGQVIGNINDDTWLDYNVLVNQAGNYTLDLRASSPWGIGVVNLLDENDVILTTVNLAPGTNGSYHEYETFTSGNFYLPAGNQTLRLDVVTSAININWMEFKTDCSDSDGDGICDSDDHCPNLDDALIGTSCDDGDACTTNDIYTTDCGCEGTLQDSDQDGVCDAEDLCPNLDDVLIGTPCDDENACTTNDVFTADCGCAGTLQDSDQDGICDAEDQCPNLDDALIGTPCDDENACTTNDVFTADCGCAGTLQDSDQDGVCDAEDQCPNLDDALIGTSCDDQNSNTINDTWTSNCNCVGDTQISFQLIDADSDMTIGAITDGDIININEVGWNLNIVASTELSAGSIQFDLDDDINFRTENQAPFAMAGNYGSNYLNWNPENTSYTVAATAYSGQNRTGEILATATINFTAVYENTNNDNVIFQLINSETNSFIRNLSHDDIIDLSVTGSQINIVAETPSDSESVVFSLNSDSEHRTEGVAPYALAGDNNGNYYNWSPQMGTYHIKARAYSQNGGNGTLLDHSTIRVNIIDSANLLNGISENRTSNFHKLTMPEMKAFPNPFNGKLTLDIQGIENGKSKISITDLNGRVIQSQNVEYYKNQPVRLNLENLESGIYLLHFTNGNNKLIDKLIKH